MIEVAAIKERLGIPPNDTLEDALIATAISAALSYLASVHPATDWTAPSPSQAEGIGWFTAAIYQEKGRVDNSVDSFTASITPMLGRQVQQMLELDFYYPPAVA